LTGKRKNKMSIRKIISDLGVPNSVICPVCGYKLGFFPWVGDSPSHQICPSCSLEFGYAKNTLDEPKDRKEVYAERREQWIKDGMKWWSKSIKPPLNWNGREQWKNAGLK
jgi:hypothetical protein